MRFKVFLLTMFMAQVTLIIASVKNPEINTPTHVGLGTFFFVMLMLEVFVFSKKGD